MQAPDNATDVAWYNFSAHPGFGGNAVFAAHVDYIRVGPAVFWNLKDLEPGDLIRVQLARRHRVHVRRRLQAAVRCGNGARQRHRRADAEEIVTLITCGGTFNSATHQYDKRLVVRAEAHRERHARARSSPRAREGSPGRSR